MVDGQIKSAFKWILHTWYRAIVYIILTHAHGKDKLFCFYIKILFSIVFHEHVQGQMYICAVPVTGDACDKRARNQDCLMDLKPLHHLLIKLPIDVQDANHYTDLVLQQKKINLQPHGWFALRSKQVYDTADQYYWISHYISKNVDRFSLNYNKTS